MKGFIAIGIPAALCLAALSCLAWQLSEFSHRRSVDLYTQLSEAIEPASGRRRTQLAHLGHIDTADGRFEVVVQRSVPVSAASPHGSDSELLLIDHRLRVAWRQPYSRGTPAWCERGKIYMLGSSDIGLPIDPGLAAQFPASVAPRGNVLDFDDGIHGAFMTEELRYASNGGLDDPWKQQWRRQ
jgi:hypothetical protein